jgi:hypothetical protein
VCGMSTVLGGGLSISKQDLLMCVSQWVSDRLGRPWLLVDVQQVQSGSRPSLEQQSWNTC